VVSVGDGIARVYEPLRITGIEQPFFWEFIVAHYLNDSMKRSKKQMILGMGAWHAVGALCNT
jgi:hypothetical protein